MRCLSPVIALALIGFGFSAFADEGSTSLVFDGGPPARTGSQEMVQFRAQIDSVNGARTVSDLALNIDPTQRSAGRGFVPVRLTANDVKSVEYLPSSFVEGHERSGSVVPGRYRIHFNDPQIPWVEVIEPTNSESHWSYSNGVKQEAVAKPNFTLKFPNEIKHAGNSSQTTRYLSGINLKASLGKAQGKAGVSAMAAAVVAPAVLLSTGAKAAEKVEIRDIPPANFESKGWVREGDGAR